jgi:hypothetical protein
MFIVIAMRASTVTRNRMLNIGNYEGGSNRRLEEKHE